MGTDACCSPRRMRPRAQGNDDDGGGGKAAGGRRLIIASPGLLTLLLWAMAAAHAALAFQLPTGGLRRPHTVRCEYRWIGA